jgi:hypothetical protein
VARGGQRSLFFIGGVGCTGLGYSVLLRPGDIRRELRNMGQRSQHSGREWPAARYTVFLYLRAEDGAGPLVIPQSGQSQSEKFVLQLRVGGTIVSQVVKPAMSAIDVQLFEERQYQEWRLVSLAVRIGRGGYVR